MFIAINHTDAGFDSRAALTLEQIYHLLGHANAVHGHITRDLHIGDTIEEADYDPPLKTGKLFAIFYKTDAGWYNADTGTVIPCLN